jgi:uncharacterized protein YjiS (DUF1127 family)
MNLNEELEFIEKSNKMIKLNRMRQNVRLLKEIGISEEDAKEIFYKNISVK